MSNETSNTVGAILDKGKLFIKAVIIFVMALALWIPTNFILELVKERKKRQEEAVADISNKWAGKQTVTGPILMIPYNEFTRNANGTPVIVKHKAYFLPDKSEMKARVFPEKRYRGIYEVIVYRSEISISGKFNALAWGPLKVAPENMLWNEAVILFAVKDNLRGINEDIHINWGDTAVTFNPQPAGLSGMPEALVAPVSFSGEAAAKEHVFSMQFALNGSEQLLFAAAARESKVEMQSSWPDPSFTGVKLPDDRSLSDSGFTANWKYMNRAVPLVWNDIVNDLSQSVLGADLLIPVDSYNKTERSVKYALLCIVLTFAVFFLIESIYGKTVHLAQYGLAGLALVLFYTLLLSISEYTGFNLAYLIASILTIGLVVWYMNSVMKASRPALFIGFVLAVVYSYIFTIIQLQDYALLMGSLGLFLALAIIMYFSRKLQW